MSLKQGMIIAKMKDANISLSSKELATLWIHKALKEITSDEIKIIGMLFKNCPSNPQVLTVEMIEQQIQQQIKADQSG